MEEELRLPIDADGFSGRQCPACEALFAVRPHDDQRLLASRLAARLRHLNESEAAEAGVRHCPYCAARASAETFLTAPALQQIERAARHLERALASPEPRPAPAGSDRARGESPGLAPLEGFRLVALPCCGREQKVVETWIGPIRCHDCGSTHVRAATRDVGLELAMVRQWAVEEP